MTLMYPFWASVLSWAIAQLMKPVFHYLVTKEWSFSIIKASGGFPSSHSALVSALSIAVGLQESFVSTIFAITAAFSAVIIYDAANVRYYSGVNIKVVKQLVKDLEEQTNISLNNPVYRIKTKDVLGHRWFEVFGGMILGVIVAVAMYYLFVRV